MEYGIKMDGPSAFYMGKTRHEIPNVEIELSTLFESEPQNYHRIFRPQDSEPLCVQRALEPYLIKLSWSLDRITHKLVEKRDFLNMIQRDLLEEEAAKIIAKDVKEYVETIEQIRQMAADKNAFAEEVRRRATLLPEARNDQEVMLRAMTQQTLRQELAARLTSKVLGKIDIDRTSRALASVGKSGDTERDLNLLAAVRSTTLFQPSEGIVATKEAEFVAAYRPWVGDFEAIANAVSKWTANRVSFEALPALKKVLPYGLTPESVFEMTEGKPERENLSEKMKHAA